MGRLVTKRTRASFLAELDDEVNALLERLVVERGRAKILRRSRELIAAAAHRVRDARELLGDRRDVRRPPSTAGPRRRSRS